jgi:hypothetical protein
MVRHGGDMVSTGCVKRGLRVGVDRQAPEKADRNQKCRLRHENGCLDGHVQRPTPAEAIGRQEQGDFGVTAWKTWGRYGDGLALTKESMMWAATQITRT